MIDYIWRINNFDVFYTNETNGGGDHFALEYIDVIKDWYGKVDHVLEWCSGPGFIGYGLYANDLCDRVSFNEMYLPAIEVLEKTKNNSDNSDNILIHSENSLDTFSRQQKIDLVVGNPPHWESIESAQPCFPFDIKEYYHVPEILIDFEWNAHRSFFLNMKELLSDSGRILLQENKQGSDPEVFETMINDADLKITGVAESQMYDMIYYLEVSHK